MIRRCVVAVALVGLIAAPGVGRAQTWSPRDADFPQVAIERDVRVTMSDGVRLAVDVLRPAGDDGTAAPGRFPVLVTQTPYNKAAPQLNFRSDYLITRGYVQVIADVRGTGASEGMWDSFGTREQIDGKEIVEWAASREWSDGNVGLHGTSYGAINQILTAAQHPEGLRAIFPVVPAGDVYRDIVGSGGETNTSFIPMWLGLVTALGLLPPTYTGNDPVGAVNAVVSHAAGAVGFQTTMLANATSGGDNSYDGPFYRERSPLEVIDRVDVPTFVVGGWFDLFQRGEPMLYERLAANGIPTRLLMGPWYHVTAGMGEGLPADGVPVLPELELRWFDHYVRGVADDDLDVDVAPVTYYRLGSGHWTTTESWPPPGVVYDERFLSGPGMAPVSTGTLAESAPAAQDPDTLVWQPASGTCTRSIAQWTAAGVNQGCEADQRTNDAVNSLVYDMPVATDTVLAGPVAARLFASTNGRDAFITARLADVSPDGAVTQISAGWNLLSLRALDESKTTVRNGLTVRPYHPFTRASVLPVEDGVLNELWVEIFPTGALIKAGHKLRFSVQASDTPHLSPSVPTEANLAGSVLQLHHSAEYPSAVVLPFQTSGP
ncbi:MAG: CocE/NonD family hydrolase [Actinomycetota bacterium]